MAQVPVRKKRDYDKWVTALVVTGCVLYVGPRLAHWAFPNDSWAIEWFYRSQSYLTSASFIFEPERHDCEFLTAPIGSKHCHYEADVTAIRVRHDQSGDFMSGDRVTWTATDKSASSSVYVAWRKVSD